MKKWMLPFQPKSSYRQLAIYRDSHLCYHEGVEKPNLPRNLEWWIALSSYLKQLSWREGNWPVLASHGIGRQQGKPIRFQGDLLRQPQRKKWRSPDLQQIESSSCFNVIIDSETQGELFACKSEINLVNTHACQRSAVNNARAGVTNCNFPTKLKASTFHQTSFLRYLKAKEADSV